jgi:hypothetical protein
MVMTSAVLSVLVTRQPRSAMATSFSISSRADSRQESAEKAAAQRQEQQLPAERSLIGATLLDGTIDHHTMGPRGALPRFGADLFDLYFK